MKQGHLKRPFRLLVLFVFVLTIWGSTRSVFADNHVPPHKDFTLGVHPYLPAQEIERRFQPLVDYLSERLGEPIKLFVSKDYESHIEHVGNNSLDIAYMGPSPYVTLTKRYGKFALLAKQEINGQAYLQGIIAIHKDSGITDIKQLAGKRFAFGSPHSTMSYIVPRYVLHEAGIQLDMLQNYTFLSNHKNVALGLLLGEYDAGAMKEEVFNDFSDKGLVEIARTPKISEHVFVAQNSMEREKVEKIRSILWSLSSTDKGKNILTAIKSGMTGFVPAEDHDYDNLRKIMDTGSD